MSDEEEFVYNPKSLPIYKKKKEILQRIARNQVIIITGTTGCGKSTQVPQYIIDNFVDSKVVCTAPTRICTVSLADYVAKIRKCEVGEEVGYAIGDRKKDRKKTKIEYQTTGVLYETLLGGHYPPGTHICVDEVHTRNIEIDGVLFLLKKIMQKYCWLKVILMSASIDPGVFSDYFVEYNPPIIHISTREFSVKTLYVDDCCKIVKKWYDSFPEDEETKDELVQPFALLDFVHRFTYNKPRLINQCVTIACDMIQIFHIREAYEKTILVFLPGIGEIIMFEKYLHGYITAGTFKVYILHSAIRVDEQKAIFEDLPNKRKIILSTNIAESSITIPDVHYIFDFCLCKEMNIELSTGCNQLKLRWCCKDNLIQRAGRAGRVQDGTVFRLMPSTFYRMLNQNLTPEIDRISLSNLVLKLKNLRIGYPENILKQFISPPSMSRILRAYTNLEENKAIDFETRKITPFGRFAVMLPLNLQSSYLLFLGVSFGFLHECIILSALLDVGSIFYHSFTRPLRSMKGMYKYSFGHYSDVFSGYFIYIRWKREEIRGVIDKDYFCVEHSVKLRTLNEVISRVTILYEKFDRKGIRPLKDPNELRIDEESIKVMRVLIGAAFRRNMVKQISSYQKILPFPEFKASRSVILSRLEDDSINSKTETKNIKKFIEGYDRGFGKVSKIRAWSSKIYVEFDKSEFVDDGPSDPIKLITKFDCIDFEKIRIPPDHDFQHLPYIKARGVRKQRFNPLFFSKKVKLSRYTILENFLLNVEDNFMELSSPDSSSFDVTDDTPYTYVFGSGLLLGKNLYLENCTKMPDFVGLTDIIFLVFGTKLQISTFDDKYLEVDNNNNLYYFKPILTEMNVNKVNFLRKYLSKPRFITRPDSRKKKSFKITKEHQKKALKTLMSLFEAYNNVKPCLGLIECDNNEQLKLFNKLKFRQELFEKKVKFLNQIFYRILDFLGPATPSHYRLIMVILEEYYVFIYSNFYRKLKKIKFGEQITFVVDKDKDLKIIKGIIPRKLQAGNKKFLQKLLRKDLFRIRSYFRNIFIRKKKDILYLELA